MEFFLKSQFHRMVFSPPMWFVRKHFSAALTYALPVVVLLPLLKCPIRFSRFLGSENDQKQPSDFHVHLLLNITVGVLFLRHVSC